MAPKPTLKDRVETRRAELVTELGDYLRMLNNDVATLQDELKRQPSLPLNAEYGLYFDEKLTTLIRTAVVARTVWGGLCALADVQPPAPAKPGRRAGVSRRR